ncbi:MAG: Lrp/AsnC family transcriptional regulator [Nitrosarchaeum sp.]
MVSEISSLGVIEVNGVLGKCDIFVKIFSENPDVMDMVVVQIRKIKMISSHPISVVYGQGGTIDSEINLS